jgi:type VI secretion system protein ImpB
MSRGSIHDKLETIRRPRVHITYKVHIGDAEVDRELPFVMGVLGDFSGQPTEPLKSLKDRKFIQIDRDNFNDVMARMTPGLNLRVENTLKNDNSELRVALKFNSMDDFDPANLVQQVEPLKKLVETRNRLRDLLTRVDRSENLENLLEQILQNQEQLQKLRSALNV